MKRFCLPLVSAVLLLSANPAAAATIEKRTAIADRTPIAVAPGIGHTIDFSGTSERVYKAWIGDGGQCLQVLGGGPLEEGTQIVNLRRFVCQNHLGFQPVDQTVVTLLTQDEQRQFSVYEFTVNYSATGESITRIVDTPLPEALVNSSDTARTALSVEAVRAGLTTFELAADSPITDKVESWAQLATAGIGHRQAARYADINWDVLERLNQLGLRALLVAEGTAL